jgi:hypothetical protein
MLANDMSVITHRTRYMLYINTSTAYKLQAVTHDSWMGATGIGAWGPEAGLYCFTVGQLFSLFISGFANG